MNNRKFTLPAVALAAALGGAGIATLPAIHAAAQSASPAPAAPPPGRPPGPPREHASHVEGRIAFMKAELKITPAQEAQWDKVAQVMRQDDSERHQAMAQMRANQDQAPNALQALEARARFGATLAQQTDRFLAAFRPLYDSLSEPQKQAANEMLGPHRHHHGHWRG